MKKEAFSRRVLSVLLHFFFVLPCILLLFFPLLTTPGNKETIFPTRVSRRKESIAGAALTSSNIRRTAGGRGLTHSLFFST